MDNLNWIGPLIGGCFVGLFFIIGLVLILKSIRDKKKAEASSSWPSAVGTVTESKIIENVSYDEDHYRRTTYRADVHYTYNVIGTPYESKKLAFGATESSSAKSAQEVIARFPVGASVPVYYNPNDPKEAVLIREAKSSRVMMILGIVFMVIALCAGSIGAASLIIQSF